MTPALKDAYSKMEDEHTDNFIKRSEYTLRKEHLNFYKHYYFEGSRKSLERLPGKAGFEVGLKE